MRLPSRQTGILIEAIDVLARLGVESTGLKTSHYDKREDAGLPTPRDGFRSALRKTPRWRLTGKNRSRKSREKPAFRRARGPSKQSCDGAKRQAFNCARHKPCDSAQDRQAAAFQKRRNAGTAERKLHVRTGGRGVS